MSNRNTFLRRVLGADALVSGLMGILLIAVLDPLSNLLGLPTSLLVTAGILLLPFAAWVGWLAIQETPPRGQVWAVVALNVLWIVESIALFAIDSYEPTTLGTAFVLVQTLAVAVFAELEYIGIRRTTFAAA